MPPTTPPPTPPANAERLLKLRAAVVNAPAEEYDMRAYRCGTKHCGAGWYVAANPNCGLKFIPDETANPTPRDYLVPASFSGEYVHSPDAYATLANHFVLTRSESYMLFGPDFDSEPGEEQKRSFLQELDALLAARGIAPPPAVRRFQNATEPWAFVWCVNPATDEGWREFPDGRREDPEAYCALDNGRPLTAGHMAFAEAAVCDGAWVELDGVAAPAAARAAEGAGT